MDSASHQQGYIRPIAQPYLWPFETYLQLAHAKDKVLINNSCK